MRIALLAVLTAAAATLLPVQSAAAAGLRPVPAAAQLVDPQPIAPGPAQPSPSPDPSSPATSPSPSPSPEPTTPAPSPSGSTSASAATPGAVRHPAWQALQGGARLRWAAPDGAPAGITYTVIVTAGGAGDGSPGRTVSTAATELVVSPVRAGTRLTASVTPNAGGATGPTTAAEPWVQPAAAPDPPTSATLAAAPGASALRVGWTPPAVDGPPLTGFVIELHTVADPAAVAARRTAPPTARTLDVRGLRAGTRYFATVAAVSAAGTGAARESPTAVAGAATTCASCAAPAAQAHAATARPAPSRPAPAVAPGPTGAAAGPQVPVSTGFPLQLTIGIGGVLLAACLAIAAVLLRRRSAVG